MILGMTNVKVTISLPPELLATLDRARRAEGATRSEYLRRAVYAHLDLHGQSEARRYIAGYEAHPETAEEVAAARASAVALLAAEPWE